MSEINWQYWCPGWEQPDARIDQVQPSNLEGFEHDVFMMPGPISRGDLSPCCGSLTVLHVESICGVHILECTWCRMGIEYSTTDESWNLGDNMGGFHAVGPERE